MTGVNPLEAEPVAGPWHVESVREAARGRGGAAKDVTSSRDEPHPWGSSGARIAPKVGPSWQKTHHARSPSSVKGADSRDSGTETGRLTESSSAGKGQP